jgi:hypothetical protein
MIYMIDEGLPIVQTDFFLQAGNLSLEFLRQQIGQRW